MKSDGAAEHAGMQPGDMLLAYNGQVVRSPEELSEAINAFTGTLASIEVLHDKQVFNYMVEAGPLGVMLGECEYDTAILENIMAASSVTVTTAPTLENHRITRTLDIVSSECAVGLSAFKDILASLTNTLGGRGKTLRDTMRQARIAAMNELRVAAYSLGGNAVIGTRIEYSEISGKEKSMLMVATYGTAVVVEADTTGSFHCERTIT